LLVGLKMVGLNLVIVLFLDVVLLFSDTCEPTYRGPVSQKELTRDASHQSNASGWRNSGLRAGSYSCGFRFRHLFDVPTLVGTSIPYSGACSLLFVQKEVSRPWAK
jgi:hypothetical protein